jgi:hypothetical protein
MLASKSTFLFGIAEGYRLLFEKGKGISEVLEFKVLYEVRSEWEYSEEAGTWFPKRRRG